MRYLLLSLFLVFFLFHFSNQVHSQESWVINNFESKINVTKTGEVLVVESIVVDFGSLQKHGIFRDIPFAYTTFSGEKIYTKIEVDNVTSNSGNIPFEVFKEGDFVRIKIGDPDKTTSGVQTYQITYTATGVLRAFDDYDEIFWNVTGNKWEVPIQKAKASATLPEDGITQLTCFEGSLGSKTNCNYSEINKREAHFESTKPLERREGLTLVVGYTKGLLPIIIVPPQKSVVDTLFTLTSIGAFVFSLILGVGVAFWLWFKSGRDYWWKRRFPHDPAAKHEAHPIKAYEPIVVEYDPPEKLRPAEIGLLLDESADTLDVTATIIDLAQRGYLSIKEEAKKWVFGKVGYVLTKKEKELSKLLPYEKELLDRIFEEKDTVKISELKTKFYQDLKTVKDKLYEEVVRKKFFYENPESVRNKYFLIGIFMSVVGAALIFLGFMLIFAILVALGAGSVLAGIILVAFSRFMPRRTAYGHDMFLRAKGYELFVSRAETYRQQFFERKNMFNEILPYAIVFGVTEKFAKAFADMGLKSPQPNWYTGSQPFNAAVFGSSISSFSNSLSSAMAAAPGGSGFSGGGSGGGFGGGGGGSW